MYVELTKDSEAINENADCAVKALANALMIDYDHAHSLCEHYGREFGRRMCFGSFQSLLESQNFERVAKNPVRTVGKREVRYTLRTIASKYPKGRFIIFVSGHFLPLIDGIIDDWSDGTAKRVKEVWKLID